MPWVLKFEEFAERHPYLALAAVIALAFALVKGGRVLLGMG